MKKFTYKYIRHKAASCFLVLLALLMGFNLVPPTTMAEVLSDSELTALDNYPNWVGTCVGSVDSGGAEQSAGASGDFQELAKEVLANANIDKDNGRVVREDLEEAAAGKPSYAGKKLSPYILAALLEIAKEHKVSISSITGNGSGHSPTSKHYKGLGIDIQSLDGAATNGSDAAAQKIVTLSGKVVPKGSSFGLGSSPDSIRLPSGTTSFSDFPNHVHIQVPVGSARALVTARDGGDEASKPVYMMGDSITAGANTDLRKAFRSASIKVAQIDGVVSRSFVSKGEGSTNGLQALEAGEANIKEAGTVILALGSNREDAVGSSTNFKNNAQKALDKVRDFNPDAKIYWVNIFSDSPPIKQKDDYNRIIEGLRGVTVIDADVAGISLSDKIHPDTAGYKKYAKTVVEAVKDDADAASARNQADSQPQCCGGETSSDTKLVGGDNEAKVWNYFKEKQLSNEQIAGIMGNMSQESGFDPENIQNPAGRTKDPSNITAGWGIIQWTEGKKILGIAEEAKITGPIYELATQLDIVWWHMNNKSPTGRLNILPEFKKANTAKEAASAFEDLMEGAGTPAMVNRWAAAEAALTKYGKSDGAASLGSVVTASGGGSCECPTTKTGTTVVLDPGHSGSLVSETDADSGIKTEDSDNGQETKDMWVVSEKVKEILEKKGYKVISTKKNEQDTVGLIARAKIANDAKAAIAVSLHSTKGDSSFNWVTPQEVGLYRQTGTKKKTFEDADLAQKSKSYSDAIVAERKNAEGAAKINRLDFPASRGLPATGNISIVQLFSKVPWVYNEIGQSVLNKDKYAEGVAKGIAKAIGDPKGGGGSGGCEGAVSGDLSATTKSYAWPTYRAPPYTEMKPAYRAAVAKAQDEGRYVGGLSKPGIDCGGFTTTLMIDSGFEPKFNYSGKTAQGAGPTLTQEKWMQENWQKINPRSTKDLQPGDIAVNSQHTFVFVGKIDGFESTIASASLSRTGEGWRTPMAGKETPADPSYNWYRKK